MCIRDRCWVCLVGGGDGRVTNTPNCGSYTGNAVANTGGGGGGIYCSPTSKGLGGSGIVLVKEDAVSVNIRTAPGIWDLNTVYEFVKADNWTNS